MRHFVLDFNKFVWSNPNDATGGAAKQSIPIVRDPFCLGFCLWEFTWKHDAIQAGYRLSSAADTCFNK
jgi:hypothetical protein